MHCNAWDERRNEDGGIEGPGHVAGEGEDKKYHHHRPIEHVECGDLRSRSLCAAIDHHPVPVVYGKFYSPLWRVARPQLGGRSLYRTNVPGANRRLGTLRLEVNANLFGTVSKETWSVADRYPLATTAAGTWFSFEGYITSVEVWLEMNPRVNGPQTLAGGPVLGILDNASANTCR